MRISRVLRSPALRTAAGWVLAAAGLLWVFHDVDARALLRSLTAIAPGWAVLGILFDVFSYATAGERWRLLLKSRGRVSALKTTQAIYAGLFLNEVLPMRVGEVARAFLVSRWLRRGVVEIVPSMALERLFEGLWLTAGLGVTALLAPLPRSLVRAGDIMGILVLALTGGFLFLALTEGRSAGPRGGRRRPRWKPLRTALESLSRLAEGFRSIGISRAFFGAFVATFFVFAFQAASFWFIMKAAGLHRSFWVGAAVFLIIHFGTALPNAPANVGTYQFFCAAGLVLFGVDKTTAAAFSIIVFILLTAPLWVIGFFALGRSGMTLGDLRARARSLEETDAAGGDTTAGDAPRGGRQKPSNRE